ncbi:DUF7854 family protein [Halorarum salinum]|uniref:Uncharacterized protein n=1 Tax=Halorarum salinum TaxID=2743089 RepID=A0A7D5Q839_9EURY|nr:hypothetical protein [Halobaculum salinum]QLG60677.1 hypothetical protein HUG12_02530 [Halobaculum salinum]
MDRISALRNVEDALREFEEGEADLAETERRVGTVLRTFATEFETPGKRAYRAVVGGSDGGDADAGTVVVASSPAEARERAGTLADRDPAEVTVEPLE